MPLLDSITREDLIHAAGDIAPHGSSVGRKPNESIILINGNRYDAEAVLSRAQTNTTGSETNGIEIPRKNGWLATFYTKRNIPFFNSATVDSAVEALKQLMNDPKAVQRLSKTFSAKERVLNRFQPLFAPERVATLPENDFVDFLYMENNGHWDVLFRSRSELVQNFDSVRKALAILVDEGQPIQFRLDAIRPKRGPSMAPGAAEAILTAILHVEYPDQYGVWNKSSAYALKNLQVWPDFKWGASFGEKYLSINEVLKVLAHELGVDLWDLDAYLWWSVSNSERITSKGVGVEDGSVRYETDNLSSEKDALESISEIAKRVVSCGLENKKLSQSDDAEENQKKYHAEIEPLLEKFKEKFSSSPNLFLNNILKGLLSEKSLADKFECQNFHFYGQKVYSYTWAAITKIDPDIRDRKVSHYPQLYILVNSEGIKYGFCYGDQVKDSDNKVTLVKQDKEIQKIIINILERNRQLHAYYDESPGILGKEDDDITDRLCQGNFEGWTSKITIIERIPSNRIPTDIVSRIENCLKSLIPIFWLTSFPEDVEKRDEILKRLYFDPPQPKQFLKWSDIKQDLAYSFEVSDIQFSDLFFSDADIQRLQSEILGALRSGKHIIFIGPPGTGKSKLASAICKTIAGHDNFQMCTASPDWSVYETIGGYRQINGGALEFQPGIFLQSFYDSGKNVNRWLVIDEINRADIDKAFGPLFSALASDDIVLQFEMNGEKVRLIGRPKDETSLKECNFIIHPDWRIIATMNTYDKSSLYDMSYAFMRRFAFIMVDSPSEIDAETVRNYVDVWKIPLNDEHCEMVSRLWTLVNRHRKIGPALFKDIYAFLGAAPIADLQSAITMYLMPQFEGVSEERKKALITELQTLFPNLVDRQRLKDMAYAFFNIDTSGIA